MATVTSHAATESDLLTTPRDGNRYELVDGQIRVSPAGKRHRRVATRLTVRLGAFVEEHRLGDLFDAQTGFRLPSGNVRVPDLAFVAAGRGDPDDPGFVVGAPDLAVEIVSPGDRRRDVLEKVGEYLDAGTRLVWIIDPQQRMASVYHGAAETSTIAADGVLDGRDVVPGFRCALADVLPPERN